MDLVESVAVLVTGVLSAAVTHRFVLITPLGQTGVDVVFIGVNSRVGRDGGQDQGLDGRLLNVFEHPYPHLTAALEHSQDGGLLLFQRAAPARAFQAPPAARTVLSSDRLGMTLMARHDIHFVALHLAGQGRLRLRRHDSRAQLRDHAVHIVLVQTQFIPDLLVGEVQSHQVQAQEPHL